MLWVLIATAPIFIACLLYAPTRGYGIGWFNQVLTYALIPLFVYVIAAFLIAAMNPELSKIDAASGSRTLTLADIAAFLLLCIAGGFVMLYIQSIGQGIAGGISTGIGSAASAVTRRLGIGYPLAIGRSTTRSAGRAMRRRRTPDTDTTGAGSAMQSRISRNGTPA
jgi:type IV secretion system protein VirB6